MYSISMTNRSARKSIPGKRLMSFSKCWEKNTYVCFYVYVSNIFHVRPRNQFLKIRVMMKQSIRMCLYNTADSETCQKKHLIISFLVPYELRINVKNKNHLNRNVRED